MLSASDERIVAVSGGTDFVGVPNFRRDRLASRCALLPPRQIQFALKFYY